ncbi:Reticulocyte-binding protein 2-like protein a [Bienertia sinuspersici]
MVVYLTLLNFCSASNKEDLINGVLFPRSGPFASYPTGPCLSYGNLPIVAANSVIPDETCAMKSASSNGVDEDRPGVAPMCHVDATEDTAGIASASHVDESNETSSYVPMSPEDQIDSRLLNVCQLEQSHARLQRSKSRQKALELRNSAKTSAKSRLGVEDNAGISSGSKTCGYDEQHGGLEKSFELDECSASPTKHCSNKEIALGNSCDKEKTGDACGVSLTRSSGSKAKETKSGDSEMEKDWSVYGGGITRSRNPSQQIMRISSGSKTCRYDEQHGGLEKSLELDERSASPTKHSSNEEIALGNSLDEKKTSDACGVSLARSSGCNAKETKSGDSEMKKDWSVYGGRITRSRSSSQQIINNHSGSETYKFNRLLDGSSGSLKLDEPSGLPSEISFNEDSAFGILSDRQRSFGACGASFTHSTVNEKKEVDIGDSQIETYSNNYENRATRSRSSFQQSVGGAPLLEYKSNEVCVRGSQKTEEFSNICGSRSTRSRSSCQQSVGGASSLGYKSNEVCVGESQKNEEYSNIHGSRITRSRNSCQQSVLGAPLLDNMSNEVCVGRTSRSRSCKTLQSEIGMGNSKAYRSLDLEAVAYNLSGKIQQTEIVMGNSKACSAKITRSRSCEEEASNMRSMFRKDVSVKPKQLDFDEVEESDLCNVPFHLSDVRASSSSLVEEGDGVNIPELEAEVNMLPDFNINHALDGSWPGYKRRKIEYKNPTKSASPTLKMNPFHAISEYLPSRSVLSEKANIPLSSWHSENFHNSVAELSDCVVLAEENDQGDTSLSKGHVRTPQAQCDKYMFSSGRTVAASTCEHQQLLESDVLHVGKNSIISEPSDSLPEDGEVKENPPSAVLISGRVSGDLANGQNEFDGSAAAKFMCTEGAMDQIKPPQRIGGLKFSIGSPQMERMNVTDTDQTIPEFESFIMGDNLDDAQNSEDELIHQQIPCLGSILDRTSLPEQICKSASLSTPVSPFPTACKLYFAPGMYSSVPNGLLENNDLRSNLLHSGSALLGKSHSDLFSFPGSQYGWDNRKPFFSPVGKGFEGMTSKSGGSDKLGNSNLELTCFPILEDRESSEEDVNDVANPSVDGSESTMNNITNNRLLLDVALQCENSVVSENAVERVDLDSVSTEVRRTDSSTRKIGSKEPLCDITMQNESTLALDHAIERHSQDSVGTEISVHDIDYSKKSGMGQRKRSEKENNGFSVGPANSSKKHSKTLSSRFSKPKLSAQSCLKSRGQSVIEKEQKRNNIVSGVKSFLPFVQQKQAAAAVPEKRDVKVKALQAAEAAKRDADMRENERKQKKEAMKLERARVEQEKKKELELKKKLKEELRKKKEAENAAKKRQREEDERKEKERKKRRIEEARLQQKQAEQKLHAWKEESRCAAEDERAHQQKITNDKKENQVGNENEGDSMKPMNGLVVVGNDQREAVGLPGSPTTGKMGNIDVAESSTPNFDKIDKPNNQPSQSYDLSPYRDSDEEEEEEDAVPKKFIPSWASQTCVIAALSSMQHLDPDVIFPPGSFCSMEEGKCLFNCFNEFIYLTHLNHFFLVVLLPRRLLQK